MLANSNIITNKSFILKMTCVLLQLEHIKFFSALFGGGFLLFINLGFQVTLEKINLHITEYVFHLQRRLLNSWFRGTSYKYTLKTI